MNSVYAVQDFEICDLSRQVGFSGRDEENGQLLGEVRQGAVEEYGLD
jgi:hypothetical protein